MQRLNASVEKLTVSATCAVSAAFFLFTLRWVGTGFEFSDEGYYLNWISAPWQYGISVTLFGYFYHPLYLLLDGDLASLRRLNIVMLAALASALCFLTLRFCRSNNETSGSSTALRDLAIAASMSVTSLTFLQLWIPTPSYNSLTLKGLLLAGIGILLASPKRTFASLLGWASIGAAGWLTFLAKPPTAFGLGFVVMVYLWATRTLHVYLTISILTFCLLLGSSAALVDGSPIPFFYHLTEAVRRVSALSEAQTLSGLFRLDRFSLGPAASWFGLVFLLTAAVTAASPLKTWTRWLLTSLILLLNVIVLIIIVLGTPPSLLPNEHINLILLSVPLGATSVLPLQRALKFEISAKHLYLALFLMTLSALYAFGTGNNYWGAAARSGIFWLAAAVAVLGAIKSDHPFAGRPTAIATIGLLITAVVVGASIQHPYRQPESLFSQNRLAAIGTEQSRIAIPTSAADYLVELKSILDANNIPTGHPAIDLTGRFPGALYAVGAKAIGSAWLIGGYSGSEAKAIADLDQVPCSELARAWILMEPFGPRKIPDQILKKYGLNLILDYEPLGVVASPLGEESASFRQTVLGPSRKRTEENNPCSDKKRARQG
jgi:hypothetical protein